MEHAGTPRSYKVQTDEGGICYRRNRRMLMKSPERWSNTTGHPTSWQEWKYANGISREWSNATGQRTPS